MLRGLKIERNNQVWQTNITYIPMKKGFMCMMAVIDVKSRFILNWSVSQTMDASWCREVLKETLDLHGAPEILNTDQGSQFTSHEFQNVLTDYDIKYRWTVEEGHWIIFIWFWRSLKYEHVYLKPAEDGLDLFIEIKQYVGFYNIERRHQSLELRTPEEGYTQIAA